MRLWDGFIASCYMGIYMYILFIFDQFGRIALEAVMKCVCGFEGTLVKFPEYPKGNFLQGKNQSYSFLVECLTF